MRRAIYGLGLVLAFGAGWGSAPSESGLRRSAGDGERGARASGVVLSELSSTSAVAPEGAQAEDDDGRAPETGTAMLALDFARTPPGTRVRAGWLNVRGVFAETEIEYDGTTRVVEVEVPQGEATVRRMDTGCGCRFVLRPGDREVVAVNALREVFAPPGCGVLIARVELVDGTPLPAAPIRVGGSVGGAALRTDAQGRAVAILRAGVYTLRCEGATAEVAVRPGKQAPATLRATGLGEVRIAGAGVRLELAWTRRAGDRFPTRHTCLHVGHETVLPFLRPGPCAILVPRTRGDRTGARVGDIVVTAGGTTRLTLPRGAVEVRVPAAWRLMIREIGRGADQGAAMDLVGGRDGTVLAAARRLTPGRYRIQAQHDGAVVWETACDVGDGVVALAAPSSNR